ncbi:MAG: IS1380 family transposase [Chitinispirillales bacterium]|jgi:hypothetical protein|nr:IS1380 family transposase [Chitinispirillales bacterium]
MDYQFDTPGGGFSVERSDKHLTTYGGMVAFASFLDQLGIIDRLVEACPVTRTSNNATPVRDILIGFILTCIQEGKRFKHIRSVQDDAALAKIFKAARRIPGDDSVRRFFESVDSDAGRKWMHQVNGIIYGSLPAPCILDWDSTVTTRYGEQEGVEVGYNPMKRNRGSHHPLVCSVAGIRLCLDMEFRPGNSGSSSGWIEMLEQLLSRLPPDKRPSLNRADVSFCSEDFASWHEERPEERPRYLFKLRKTARVMEAINNVDANQWQGAASFGVLQVAETMLKLRGWSRERRVVLGRRLVAEQSAEESGTLFGTCRYEYSAWVTNLTKQQADAFQAVELYQKRADCENIFDELKNQWGFTGFCSQHSNVTELAARLTLLSYNLWSLFSRFFSGRKHQEAQTSRRDYLLLAGQMVETGREKHMKLAVNDTLWQRIEEGYRRLQIWLRLTAPQLGRHHNKLQALVNSVMPDYGLSPGFNCGF